jgi:PAS domain S-box-containing protein
VQTGEQRWTDGTYAIHDIDPGADCDPTVDVGVNFYHPDDRYEIEQRVERCQEMGEPYDVELRLITADDRLRWVRAIGEPVRKDGDIVTIRGAIRDITQRKERERGLSEEKEKYSTLVEQSHDGILVLQDWEIKFVNEQTETILNYEEAELLGKPFLEIVAPNDRERIQGRYQRRLDPGTESPPAEYDIQFLTNTANSGTQIYQLRKSSTMANLLI